MLYAWCLHISKNRKGDGTKCSHIVWVSQSVRWEGCCVFFFVLLHSSLQLSQTFNCGSVCGRGCQGGSSPGCCKLGVRAGPDLLPRDRRPHQTVTSSSWHSTPEAPNAAATPLSLTLNYSPSPPFCLTPVSPPDIIQPTMSVYTHLLINRLDSEHIDAGIGLIDHIQPACLDFQR